MVGCSCLCDDEFNPVPGEIYIEFGHDEDINNPFVKLSHMNRRIIKDTSNGFYLYHFITSGGIKYGEKSMRISDGCYPYKCKLYVDDSINNVQQNIPSKPEVNEVSPKVPSGDDVWDETGDWGP